MEYVVGFVYSAGQVLLVNKLKPSWQSGRLNGVGGKIEAGENPNVAIVREFKEKVSFEINDWKIFATLTHNNAWKVYFYSSFHNRIDMLVPKYNDVGEELAWCNIHSLPSHIMHNLNWLIPLSLDSDIIRPSHILDSTSYD